MKKNELKIINAVLAVSHSRATPSETLGRFTAALANITLAERVALYLSREDQGELLLASETAPAEAPPSPTSFPAGSPPAELAIVPGEARLSEEPSAVEPAWNKYPHAVFLPLAPGNRRGLLVILSHRPEKLRALSSSFFSMMGKTLGLELEELFMSRTVHAQINELRLLHEIGLATYATLDLDQLLPLVARHTAETLSCDACHILIRPRTGHEKDRALSYSWPQPPGGECPEEVFREIHQRLMEGGSLELDLPSPPCDHPAEPVSVYQSGFALRDQREVIGSCILLHRRPFSTGGSLFVEGDRRAFMDSLAAQVSMAVTNALNYAEARRLATEHEDRVRELSVLFEVTQALSGTMKLDDILKMILTAATYGHGLGFNRAALFLMNEKTHVLQGMMGIGPENSQEAARVWSELSARSWALSEALKMSVQSQAHSSLNTAVKTVRLVVAPESGILARCVLERRAYNIHDIEGEPLANRVVAEKLGSRAFAAAPMIAEGKVLGVLAVDNLFNGRPITERDVRLLSTFANKAAVAISNAQLYSRLERANQELKGMYRRLSQAERLAALGEMAATVAHEVRNPLVSVGGFARRLERRLDKDDPNRRYTGIILKEITRLEKFLSEILIFSRELPLSPTQVDMNRVINELADFFQDELEAKHIALDLKLADDLPLIVGDPEQFSQVLMNFFTNSIDVLATGGTITIQTLPLTDEPFIQITFSDNGGGVPEELVPNIFHPFFTTKSRGTGLGLPLVHKMIKNHQGTIEVQNDPGKSLTFVVRLPLKIDSTRLPALPKEGLP